MARSFGWLLAALLLVPVGANAGQAQAQHPPADAPAQARNSNSGPRKWWVNTEDRASLGITDQQSAAIEDVWQKSLPELRDGWQKLHTLEDALDQMIRNSADEPAVIAQINHVEDTRARLNEARQLMLYRMNRVLKPEQRDKLKAMHDRREPPHRGSSPR
jgi:Spy/CpxP family protein refolding chaperone